MIHKLAQISLVFISQLCYAQFEDDYKRISYHNRKSKHLLRYADERYAIQKTRLKKYPLKAAATYEELTEALKSAIEGESFVKSDTLQLVVDSIYHAMLRANEQSVMPGRVLIARSPEVNAFCVGEGTLVVTLGLLAALQTEGELAFVLAHEWAHYEEDHVWKKLYWQRDNHQQYVERRLASRISKGTIRNKDLMDFNDVTYGAGRFSRQIETTADSLGASYISRAGFPVSQSLHMLDKLDSAEQRNPAVGPALFTALSTPNFPFDPHWLKSRASIYSAERASNSFLLRSDSIRSHPDIPLRKEKLVLLFKESPSPVAEKKLPDLFRKVATFETVEAAWMEKHFDVALYYALLLKQQFPNNRYLTTMIAKINIELLNGYDMGTFNSILSAFTVGYGEDLRRVNDFLNNISQQELGELAFNFMNYQQNFDPACEEHYWLLYKICDLTDRDSVKDKVKTKYRETFPKGKYKAEMR